MEIGRCEQLETIRKHGEKKETVVEDLVGYQSNVRRGQHEVQVHKEDEIAVEVVKNEDYENEENTEIQPNEREQIKIGLACLKPEELFQVIVILGKERMSAVIDTGATNNLIEEKIVKKMNMDTGSKCTTLKGLGKHTINTLGQTNIDMQLGGFNFPKVKFEILKETVADSPIVLGTSFLRQFSGSINMSKRRLGLKSKDGTNIVIYCSRDGEMETMVCEALPVFSAQDMNLKKNEVAVASLTVNLSVRQKERLSGDWHFTGITNKKYRTVDGIIGKQQDDPKVYCVAEADTTVKQGEKMGLLYTLIQVDDIEEVDEGWTRERIRAEVKIGSQLNEEQKTSVVDMLSNIQCSLSKNENDIGKANVLPHSIEITDNTPIWQKPRRFSDPITKEIERQCNELLELDVIEPSHSQWSSPIVPVRKKNGDLRMCIDYRKVNSVTKQDRFPMPNLTDSIYAACNMKYFTSLDLIKGYYQVPIEENSRPYTAFSTTHNHYQFKRLSFGLRNSGLAFQRTMQDILKGIGDNNVIVYIDDILIMTNTFEEHLQLVGQVLTTLGNYGIKVKVNKCEFFQEQVTFLGHLISNRGIKKSPQYIEKIVNYPKPSNTTQLRQFLGLANFQRKFVNRCSEIARPLSELTGQPKKQEIEWNEEREEAYETLKRELIKDVTLSFPDYSPQAEKLELYVDASSRGAGCCLSQVQQGEYRVIGYSSMTFSDTQRNYSTTERELEALRWGIKSCRAFLFGVPFLLYTDHKPLLYLKNTARENSRLTRTLNEIAEYEFQIKYQPGKDNEAADAMSRMMKGEEKSYGVNTSQLPKGMRVSETVEGGGNSLFDSLIICMKELENEVNIDTPKTSQELREELVQYVLDNQSKFKMKFNKEQAKYWRVMKHDGQLPSEEVLLALAELYPVQVWVHHGMEFPVIFKKSMASKTIDSRESKKAQQETEEHIIHLQCLSGIHYNPVFSKVKEEKLLQLISQKQINYTADNSDQKGNEGNKVLLQQFNDGGCSHSISLSSKCVASVDGVEFCAILDTGAQVSLIAEDVWNKIKCRDGSLQLEDSGTRSLCGLSGSKTKVKGVVNLKITIKGIRTEETLPFAVVPSDELPCCCLLGANFLSKNGITISLDSQGIHMADKDSNRATQYLQGKQDRTNRHQLDVISYLTSVTVDSSENDESDRAVTVRFTLDRERLEYFQNSDFAIRNLRTKIKNGTPTGLWRNRCLMQFRRYRATLQVSGKLVVRKHPRCQDSVPVVPFDLLVEIIQKVHSQLGHIGRHKLIEIVLQNFWHPAVDKVARDICACCDYCQKYKISSQPIYPPTLKIQASHPFDLVAIDLLQLPKSLNRNVALVMVIDHYSKFLYAAPIPDKTAKTVSGVIINKILPFMIKTPNRILTDNGPEFRSDEFTAALDSLNIKHIHSTRYRAQGNGAIERSNRTITEILRGLVDDQPAVWDRKLARALVIYNNTYHTEIGQSPSEYLLSQSFNVNNNLPVDNSIIETWKEGHPKFDPYRIGDKVLVKVQKIGNSLKHKFSKKYEGPHKIVKVQSNGVSYEVLKEDQGVLLKVHHKQIKLWKEVPNYLKKFLIDVQEEEITEQNSQRKVEKRVARMGTRGNWDAGFLSLESESSEDDWSEEEMKTSRRGNVRQERKECVDRGTQTMVNEKSSENKECESIEKMFASGSEKHRVDFAGFQRSKEDQASLNHSGNLASSPITTRIQRQVSLDLSPIPNVGDVANGEASQSSAGMEEVIFSIVEQSINFQEEIVDMLVEAEERRTERTTEEQQKSDVQDGDAEEIRKQLQEIMGQLKEEKVNQEGGRSDQVKLDSLFYENTVSSFKGFNTQEENFQGFGQDSSATRKTTAALEALKTMKHQIAFSRSRILGDSSESISIIRRRLSNIDLASDKYADCIALVEEVPDRLSPLPRMRTRNMRRQSLLKISNGQIPEYP